MQLLQWPDNGGTMPSKSTPFTPSSILFRPRMVEAPGTAPGSEWFIAAAIYRHSRQAGAPNIGAKGPTRKGRRAVLHFSWPDARTRATRSGSSFSGSERSGHRSRQALTVGACRIPRLPRFLLPNLTPPRPLPPSRLCGRPSPSCVSPLRASRYPASVACWRGRARCWLKTKVG